MMTIQQAVSMIQQCREERNLVTLTMVHHEAIAAEHMKTNSVGRLHVCVVGAENMPHMDLIGCADPYCVVEFGRGCKKRIRQTEVRTRDVDPIWNEHIEFALIIFGFGAALWVTGKLGWKQAFGAAEGMVTAGPYAYSRNPVYVATWAGMIGWALCLPHPAILIPLALWALLYYLAPSLEEPWLEQKFGAAYITYKAKTPRFFGL